MQNTNSFYNLKSIYIFFISIIVVTLFYFFELVIGIDKFYHPDSLHYLNPKNKELLSLLKIKIFNPMNSFKQDINFLSSKGYYLLMNLFDYKYTYALLFNFAVYSATNVLIYNYIFKNYFFLNRLNTCFIIFLLFLEPYRLHLASHVLKETIILFFLVYFMFTKNLYLKIFSLFFMELFRAKAFVYILSFINIKNIKKTLFFLIERKRGFQKNFILFVFLVIIICFSITLIYNDDFLQNIIVKFFKVFQKLDMKEMPIREYDKIPNFAEYDYPLRFFLKNISWTAMFLTGTFIFFTQSLLFKVLGFFIFLNNIIIFYITKKSFISLGLILVILLISMYSASYTAMFRYSYLAYYVSILYFFFTHSENERK